MNIDKGKVSGFIGHVNFKIKAQTRQINQLINLLLEFANYSGIGIKTAIGMGRVFTSRKLTLIQKISKQSRLKNPHRDGFS